MIQDKNINQNTEPDSVKAKALKDLLIEKISDNCDNTPIKMIETISLDRTTKKFLYNFVPYLFTPKHSCEADGRITSSFEGSADELSYHLDLKSGEKVSALSKDNPKNYQATLFIDDVIDFQIS